MDRTEAVRRLVERVLDLSDSETKRCGYIHLYGVAQLCGLLALRRHEDTELAMISGLLHDLYTYETSEREDHAPVGADYASGLLRTTGLFLDHEIETISHAIYCHSDKASVNSALDEILKDADVLQHYLYDPPAYSDSRGET